MRTSFSTSVSSIILFSFLGLAMIAGIVLAIVFGIRGKNRSTGQTDGDNVSYFDGGTFAYLGLSLLSKLLSLLSLGFAFPWLKCMFLRWEKRHTVIDGRRLAFDGTGGQLFWRYILWEFLSIITIGIFSFWATVKMMNWEAEHTYAEGTDDHNSRFEGSGIGYLGNRLLVIIITIYSLGIAYAWASKIMLCWEYRNTVISSRKLSYTGGGGQLFGHYILWGFLCLVTVGIYGLFVPVRVEKLIIGNVHNAPLVNSVVGYASGAYSQASYKDCVRNDATRFNLAETNRQLNFMKLGINENTPFNALYPLVQQNIPEAQYMLAMQMKLNDENGKVEQITDLLKKSADAGFAPSQYEYSDLLASGFSETAENVSETAAGYFMQSVQGGFLPSQEQYMHYCLETGIKTTSEFQNADDTLLLGVYWHDIVVERAGQISEEDSILYNAAVDILRRKGIQFRVPSYGAENVSRPAESVTQNEAPAQVPPTKRSRGKTAAIIICSVVGGLVIVGLMIWLIMSSIGRVSNLFSRQHQAESSDIVGTWSVSSYYDNVDAFYVFSDDGLYRFYSFYDDYNDINIEECIMYYEEGSYSFEPDDRIYFQREAVRYPDEQLKEIDSSYRYDYTYRGQSILLTADNGNYSDYYDFQKNIFRIDRDSCDTYNNSRIYNFTGEALDANETLDFLQGKWYSASEFKGMMSFLTLSFDEFSVETGNFKCNVNNGEYDYHGCILYNSVYYSIEYGNTKQGTVSITNNGDGEYVISITYQHDETNDEETYGEMSFVIDPDDNDHITVIMVNGIRVTQEYVRGDIDELISKNS